MIDRNAQSATPRREAARNRALVQILQTGPMPAVQGVVRWRLIDLVERVSEEFHLSVSPQTPSRELRALAYQKRSARPRHHAQNPGTFEQFERTSPPPWR